VGCYYQSDTSVTPKKYGSQRDANEPDIVKALEAIGCSVVRLDTPTDLLCGYRKRCYLLEVKNPKQDKAHRKKTKAQDKFFAEWNGQVDIVETAEEAIRIVTGERNGRAI